MRGYAVAFHAQPRFTKDLDLWIEASSANCGWPQDLFDLEWPARQP